MKHFISFLFVLNYLVLRVVTEGTEEQTPKSCYITSPHESTLNNWKLIWREEFTSLERLQSLWMPEYESTGEKCHGNGISQVSCNVDRNVYLQSGYLVLTARHEQYKIYSYTGARLTSRVPLLRPGRLEVRASQPLGKSIRTSIYTVNPNDTYWHEYGQLDIASRNEDPNLYRGVHFANSKDLYQSMDHMLPVNNTQNGADSVMKMPEFHVYGLEWSPKEVRFFFDDLYSRPIMFTPERHLTLAAYNLRFQIGVGGEHFMPPYPSEHLKLGWKCPAQFVDYIRFYEKVDSAFGLEKCPQDASGSQKETERKTTEMLCNQALKGITPEPPMGTKDKLAPKGGCQGTQMSPFVMVQAIALFVILSLYI